MEQLIDIKLLKENNQIPLTNLPEKVRNELLNFYQYLFFKYNIRYDEKNNEIETRLILNKQDKFDKKEFLSFLRKGFSVTEEEIYKIEQTKKEINKWEIQKF